MAQNLISPAYTFTPGSAGVGTLNLSGIAGFSIKRLVAVVNVTRGVVIYSPVNPATSVSSTTLTLGVDTSTHNAADNLFVKYDYQNDSSITNPSATFTRPSNTTAYATGDLVANSTTAGSVVAMSLTPTAVTAGSFVIRRVKLDKSGTSTTNAAFRLHLFRAAPGTVTNGDNGAFSVSGVADYVGCVDIVIDRAFTDGAAGDASCDFAVKLASGTTLYALLEARAAYTPSSAEVFVVTLDVLND